MPSRMPTGCVDARLLRDPCAMVPEYRMPVSSQLDGHSFDCTYTVRYRLARHRQLQRCLLQLRLNDETKQLLLLLLPLASLLFPGLKRRMPKVLIVEFCALKHEVYHQLLACSSCSSLSIFYKK
jgi:hypothetical protein